MNAKTEYVLSHCQNEDSDSADVIVSSNFSNLLWKTSICGV
jgi:hypothetical protein